MAEKREIIFQKTMNADKRNADSAYLIKNVMDVPEKGLYPRIDYRDSDTGIPSGYDLVDIIGTTDGERPWVVVADGDDHSFFVMGASSDVDDIEKHIIAMAYGGAKNNVLYFVEDDDDKVYRVRDGVSSEIAEVATFPSTPNVDIGIWDGLYFWWIGTEIWRQLEGGTPELMMSNSGIDLARFVANYDDYIVIFSQARVTTSGFSGEDSEIKVFFYDKANTTFFSKRITMQNAVLLGGANVGGRLMLVRQEESMGNDHEEFGRIVVMAWDGVEFREINAIKTGGEWLRIPPSILNGVTCKAGERFMLLAVDNNDIYDDKQPDLFKNYVYRIYRDGSIQVESEVAANGSAGANYARAVYVGPRFLAYGVTQSGVYPPKIMFLEDRDEEYDRYRNYTQTEYITNFMCNPYNEHKLLAMNFSFEKMFRNAGLQTGPQLLQSTLYALGNIGTSLDIGFYQATDSLTPQNEIKYAVFKSPIGNISNVAEIELNGTQVSEWTTYETGGMGMITVTDVVPEEVAYFNVIAEDLSGNRTSFSQQQITLNEEAQATAWLNPTENGAMYDEIELTDYPTFTNPENAYTEGSSFAECDDTGVYSVYYGFGASLPSGADVLRVEARYVGNILPNAVISTPQVWVQVVKGADASNLFGDIVSGTGFVSCYDRETPGHYYITHTNWAEANISDTEVAAIGFVLSNNSTSSSDPVRQRLHHIQMRVIYK